MGEIKGFEKHDYEKLEEIFNEAITAPHSGNAVIRDSVIKTAVHPRENMKREIAMILFRALKAADESHPGFCDKQFQILKENCEEFSGIVHEASGLLYNYIDMETAKSDIKAMSIAWNAAWEGHDTVHSLCKAMEKAVPGAKRMHGLMHLHSGWRGDPDAVVSATCSIMTMLIYPDTLPEGVNEEDVSWRTHLISILKNTAILFEDTSRASTINYLIQHNFADECNKIFERPGMKRFYRNTLKGLAKYLTDTYGIECNIEDEYEFMGVMMDAALCGSFSQSIPLGKIKPSDEPSQRQKAKEVRLPSAKLILALGAVGYDFPPFSLTRRRMQVMMSSVLRHECMVQVCAEDQMFRLENGESAGDERAPRYMKFQDYEALFVQTIALTAIAILKQEALWASEKALEYEEHDAIVNSLQNEISIERDISNDFEADLEDMDGELEEKKSRIRDLELTIAELNRKNQSLSRRLKQCESELELKKSRKPYRRIEEENTEINIEEKKAQLEESENNEDTESWVTEPDSDGLDECSEVEETDIGSMDQSEAWRLAEHREGRYLFVGGHRDKKAMLMEIYPNSYFFDKIDQSTISVSHIVCDHVFIFWNTIAHSTIKKVLSGLGSREIEFSYIRNGNICHMVKSIEEELRKEVEKKAGEKQEKSRKGKCENTA